MPFPYEKYKREVTPFPVFYSESQASLAYTISASVDHASQKLKQLLDQQIPKMQMLLVEPADWHATSRDDPEEPNNVLPYWTTVTHPPSLVIPSQLDPIMGQPTQEKLFYLIYTVLAQTFLESDSRPWPEENPLWADEWQMQFAAVWLMQQINGQSDIVMKDLQDHYAEIFEPELDGKTPVTIRGFDWYEDTSEEDYLIFNLLLEQFAFDLLQKYSPEILPRFLEMYRKDYSVLLSDDVTDMFSRVLGPGGAEWLEDLVYF
ncbi:MAG: hypothetical protein ACXVDN_18895 [Ktedonobacteraceae bacterium]